MLHQCIPNLRFTRIRIDRLADTFFQGFQIVLQKGESICLTVKVTRLISTGRREPLDRIDKAPRCVHDGNRSVSQRIQLVQAAWFVATWHQKHIAGCFDSVSKRIRKLKPHGNPIRAPPCQFRKGMSEPSFSISKNDPLGIERVDKQFEQRLD